MIYFIGFSTGRYRKHHFSGGAGLDRAGDETVGAAV
jgi:hypothetical protein